MLEKLQSPRALRDGRYRALIVEGLAEWWRRTEVKEWMAVGPPDPRRVQAHGELEQALAALCRDPRAPVWLRVAAYRVPVRAVARALQHRSQGYEP